MFIFLGFDIVIKSQVPTTEGGIGLNRERLIWSSMVCNPLGPGIVLFTPKEPGSGEGPNNVYR